MADRSVVILGGGTGGVVAARRLRHLLDSSDRVVMIDRTPTYRFAPSFLWVMTGNRRPGQVAAQLSKLRKAGIEMITAEIEGIDLGGRAVMAAATQLRFDRLVIALGAELAPDALPGFSDFAHNVYTVDGAVAAFQALGRFEGGRVAVVVSSLPYKCPAAPYETAFLAEAMLRRRGVSERTAVDIYTPEPLPMPTAGPVLGEALKEMLAQRGIGFHPTTTVESIEKSDFVLADSSREPYDLLLGVPAHRAPAVVASTALASPSGFLPVDANTLATPEDGVVAIGDVTAIPLTQGKFLPKAGVFAEAQAKVVAQNIAAELTGKPASARFDGKGACFVELGDGRAAFATGSFYGAEGPAINLRRPGRHWHWAKVAFEQYWMRRWL
jgi:sulfide:quinone oxidoreductase